MSKKKIAAKQAKKLAKKIKRLNKKVKKLRGEREYTQIGYIHYDDVEY